MQLMDVQNQALELMTKHGLTNWGFDFNSAKKRAGICFFPGWVNQRGSFARVLRPGRIELSTHFIEHNPEEEIRDCVLHEVAHALAFVEHQHKGHGHPWRQICLRIGARPERCYKSNEVNMPRGPWRGQCSSCGQEFDMHRKPRTLSGYSCKKCGPEKGSFVWTYRVARLGGVG